MVKEIYVNLAVKDLKRAMDFYSALGFSFEPKFRDENAACMIVGKNIYVMLLVEKFFKTFTKKELCDTGKSVEALLAIFLDSRQAVDALVAKAKAQGAKIPRPPQDHGFMYAHAFEDLDGHTWEPSWMQPQK